MISVNSGHALQVQEFLEVDPENGEYVEMANGLQEVSSLDIQGLLDSANLFLEFEYRNFLAE